MDRKTTYCFEVETVRSGQPRPYADSIYEYIVTNKCEINYSAAVIENFCKGFLRPPVRFTDSPCVFDSRETFEQIGDRKFRYMQVVPSTN